MHRHFSQAWTGFCCMILLAGSVIAAGAQEGTPFAIPGGTKQTPKKPGRDRWPVKTGQDADADAVNTNPVKTTVEAMLALPRPAGMPLNASAPEFQNKRAQPVETTVWQIEADVLDFKAMPDGDYRVTIRGASGKTLILEMPNPGPEFVRPDSRFAGEIKAARTAFDTKMNPAGKARPEKAHAIITGVGFFGRNYNPKTAEKGNLIQLHPVLKIVWLDKPTANFKAKSGKK